MLAPAEVPATTAPRWCAATIASPTGVPQMIAESLSWLPPVMKTPVASSTALTRSGSWASSRLSGRTGTTSPAPSRRNRASYTSTTSSPSEEAVGISGDPRIGAAAGRDELLEDRALAQLVLGAADDHERSGTGAAWWVPSMVGGMTPQASRCQSGRVQQGEGGRRRAPPHRGDAPRQGRAGGPHGLRAGDRRRGHHDSADAGAWLARQGFRPRPRPGLRRASRHRHVAERGRGGRVGARAEPVAGALRRRARDGARPACASRPPTRPRSSWSGTTRRWPTSPRCSTTATATPTWPPRCCRATRPARWPCSSTTASGPTSRPARGSWLPRGCARPFHVGRG